MSLIWPHALLNPLPKESFHPFASMFRLSRFVSNVDKCVFCCRTFHSAKWVESIKTPAHITETQRLSIATVASECLSNCRPRQPVHSESLPSPLFASFLSSFLICFYRYTRFNPLDDEFIFLHPKKEREDDLLSHHSWILLCQLPLLHRPDAEIEMCDGSAKLIKHTTLRDLFCWSRCVQV